MQIQKNNKKSIFLIISNIFIRTFDYADTKDILFV